MNDEPDNKEASSDLDVGNIRGSRKYKTRDHHMEMERVATTREYADSREMSDEEFYKYLNESDGYSALPQPPKVPGWHLKWGSTTNETDNVANDLRRGYSLVKPEDVPGWHIETLKGGQYEGCISYKEMVLVKLPESRYQGMMEIYHMKKPMELEAGILERAEQILVDGRGRKIGSIAEGTSQLGKAPTTRPAFS